MTFNNAKHFIESYIEVGQLYNIVVLLQFIVPYIVINMLNLNINLLPFSLTIIGILLLIEIYKFTQHFVNKKKHFESKFKFFALTLCHLIMIILICAKLYMMQGNFTVSELIKITLMTDFIQTLFYNSTIFVENEAKNGLFTILSHLIILCSMYFCKYINVKGTSHIYLLVSSLFKVYSIYNSFTTEISSEIQYEDFYVIVLKVAFGVTMFLALILITDGNNIFELSSLLEKIKPTNLLNAGH
ncbi:hypothetical protein NUSPORA_01958 [Nucleospora cyclopteri]